MTKSSSTSRNLFLLLLLMAALIFPVQVAAAVKIVGVLYDPPGADQGREWIQIKNTGASPVDLLGYRLFEGGTNHKLTVVEGTSTLLAGSTAIIVTDPAQYRADHISFAGTLLKSSFSLSNTGETIELKDATLAIVDSYSYTAPLVVKTPAPAKAVKAPKPVTSSVVSAATTAPVPYIGRDQAASGAVPELPAMPSPWLYGLGLLALLVIGAGATLYARPATMSMAATSSSEEEFELE